MFQEAERQCLRVTDVEIVGLGSKINFILGGYSMDDDSKGTEENERSESSAKNKEVPMEENTKKWCELCSNTGCILKLMEQDIQEWASRQKNSAKYNTTPK